MNAIRLVARRELTERVRERSFLISTGITLVIVVIVLVLPALLGFGGPNEYTVAGGDPRGQAVAERAVQLSKEFDAKVTADSVAIRVWPTPCQPCAPLSCQDSVSVAGSPTPLSTARSAPKPATRASG